MNPAKKLSELVYENRSIIDQLVGISIPSQYRLIQEKCEELFRVITQKDNEYLSNMSLLEQDIVMPIISLVGKVYDVPFDIDSISRKYANDGLNDAPEINKSEKKVEKFFKEHADLSASAAAGLIGSGVYAFVADAPFTKSPFSGCGIFWGTLSAVLVGKVVSHLLSEKKNTRSHSIRTSKALSEYTLTRTDVNKILDTITSFASAVDEVLVKYRNHIEVLNAEFMRKNSRYSLDQEYLSVLECYQTVLGNLAEISSEPSASDSIKQLNVSLHQQGYRVVHYSDDVSDWFEAKEGAVDSMEEFKPAIVKTTNGNDSLILKGGVVIPISK